MTVRLSSVVAARTVMASIETFPMCYGLPELHYPFHDKDVLVTQCGRICLHRKKINISSVMAGQRLGIKEVDDAIWLVSFMLLKISDISTWNREHCKPSTVRSARDCHPCLRYNLLPMSPVWTLVVLVAGAGLEPTIIRS